MSSKEIPFGKIEDNRIYLHAWGNHPDRIIGEVKTDEDTSITYFEEKFQELAGKITQVEEEISESQNKGSFLMKLIHLKELLPQHDGLGDYAHLEQRIESLENLIQDIIEKNRERNTEIKTALLQEVKDAAEKINWKEATVEIHDIKSRWIKTGNAKEEVHATMESEFWGVIDQFFEKKKQFYEDKKLLGEKRKREYESLINRTAELEKLYGKARFDLVAQLKEDWKLVGNIPKEEYDPLLKIFNRKLKPQNPRPQRSSSTPTRVSDITRQLQAYLEGTTYYNFKELETIKMNLKAVRANSFDEKRALKEAFQNIQLLMERDFIDKLANKRFKNFREMERAKKSQIRIGILEELISRDKADLEKYQENSANFNASKGEMLSLVEKKLAQQKGKIEVKERLLQLFKVEK